MGSGSRFKFWFCPKWWIVGVFFDSFPYERTVGIALGPFQVEYGFGRPYDDLDVV